MKSHPRKAIRSLPLDGEDVYFVHGYGAAMAAAAQGDIAATTDYGGR